MAEKRMFSNALMNGDRFLRSVDNSAKLLYVYLCLGADDCGFNDHSGVVMGSLQMVDGDEKIKQLVKQGYLMTFEDDEFLYLITDWNVNNYLQRFRARSKYMTRLRHIYIADDGKYTKDKTAQLAFNYFERSNNKEKLEDDKPDWIKNLGKH